MLIIRFWKTKELQITIFSPAIANSPRLMLRLAGYLALSGLLTKFSASKFPSKFYNHLQIKYLTLSISNFTFKATLLFLHCEIALQKLKYYI